MNGYETPEDQEPVTWLSGYPIYAAHFIVMIFVSSFLVTAGISFIHHEDWLQWLMFSRSDVLRGEVWRVVTYGFVNPPWPKENALYFAVDMFLIAQFGRELERAFGRKAFLGLFTAVYFISPLVETIIPFGETVYGERGAFALFIAFATLYPNIPILFDILTKWLALVLVGIYSVYFLSLHKWGGLASLWATSAFAFAWVRHKQGRLNVPTFSLPKRNPPLQVLPDLKPKKSAVPKTSKESSMVEVDALLDKIAATGMSSLTPKERATLDRAREELLKKESSHE